VYSALLIFSSKQQSVWPLNSSSSESSDECYGSCGVYWLVGTYTLHWALAPQLYRPLQHQVQWPTAAALLQALLRLPLLRSYIVTQHWRDDTCQLVSRTQFHSATINRPRISPRPDTVIWWQRNAIQYNYHFYRSWNPEKGTESLGNVKHGHINGFQKANMLSQQQILEVRWLEQPRDTIVCQYQFCVHGTRWQCQNTPRYAKIHNETTEMSTFRLTDWLSCGFMPHSIKHRSLWRRSPSQSLGLVWKNKNLTQQKHTFTNQNKRTTTQNKHKKLKPGLVASYDIRPGNGEGLFVFWRFINCHLLIYLDTYPLTYSPHGANIYVNLHSSSCCLQLIYIITDKVKL